MTDAEERLWQRLRRKQLRGVQFYRQRPLGNFIVDFYAPAVALVVEVDGAHHLGCPQAEHDQARTIYLRAQGLRVVRFTNPQVLQQLDTVVEAILKAMEAGRKPA